MIRAALKCEVTGVRRDKWAEKYLFDGLRGCAVRTPETFSDGFEHKGSSETQGA